MGVSIPTININGDSEDGLFSTNLISPAIAAILPESYTVRPMRRSDYARGFLDCLRILTTVGDITEEAWNERYDWMTTQGKGGYYLLVIDDGTRIVGTGALVVERKLCVNTSLPTQGTYTPLAF
jgi:glucosamine-phosphate N-acetyltransferase